METLEFLKALGFMVLLGGVPGLLVIGLNEYFMRKG